MSLSIRTIDARRAGQRANKATCLTEAAGIWSIVRHGGRDSFYNR
jgi:hypothetical protein